MYTYYTHVILLYNFLFNDGCPRSGSSINASHSRAVPMYVQRVLFIFYLSKLHFDNIMVGKCARGVYNLFFFFLDPFHDIGIYLIHTYIDRRLRHYNPLRVYVIYTLDNTVCRREKPKDD